MGHHQRVAEQLAEAPKLVTHRRLRDPHSPGGLGDVAGDEQGIQGDEQVGVDSRYMLIVHANYDNYALVSWSSGVQGGVQEAPGNAMRRLFEPDSLRPTVPRPRAGDVVFAITVCLVAAAGVLGATRGTATAFEPPSAVSSPAVAATPPRASNPLAGITPCDLRFAAVVDERIRAGGYAYLKLTDSDGQQRWLATMGTGPTPGSHVHVHAYGSRTDFHSARTGKTFEQLLFGEIEPKA